MGKTLKFLYFSCGISFGLPFQLLFTPLKEGFMKKSSCSFGFCPNEEGGGRALPKFVVHFSQTVYWDGEGGGDPCPNFLANWRSTKVVQVVQIRGRGVEQVIWTKSKRTATFFFMKPSLSLNLFLTKDH